MNQPSNRSPARSEVLLVDGEPVAGFELPRHVVPPAFAAHRVLSSDGPALRRALGRLPFAAIVDGRSDTASLARTLAEIRLGPAGEALPVIVVVGGHHPVGALPGTEIVTVPIDLPSIHARLTSLAEATLQPVGVAAAATL